MDKGRIFLCETPVRTSQFRRAVREIVEFRNRPSCIGGTQLVNRSASARRDGVTVACRTVVQVARFSWEGYWAAETRIGSHPEQTGRACGCPKDLEEGKGKCLVIASFERTAESAKDLNEEKCIFQEYCAGLVH